MSTLDVLITPEDTFVSPRQIVMSHRRDQDDTLYEDAYRYFDASVRKVTILLSWGNIHLYYWGVG